MREKETPKIDWKKYLDRIFLIHCANYKDRLNQIMSELRRVGILDSGILEIKENYVNPVDNFLKSKTGVDPRTIIMPLYIESYRILAESLFKGYERIAIVEDDALFMKDIDKIVELMENFPQGYNLIQMSRISNKSKYIARNWDSCRKNRINDYFVRADGYEIWSGTFYIVSREGMKQLLDIMAKNARNPDGLFHKMNKVAISLNDIAIQGAFKNSIRGSRYDINEFTADKDIFGTKVDDYGA